MAASKKNQWKQLPHRELSKYDTTSLERNDPNRLEAIVRALSEGMGINATSRVFGVCPETVYNIMERYPEHCGEWRARVSRHLGKFINLAVSRLTEEVDDIPLGQLSVSLGICMDKKANLDSQPDPVGTKKQMAPIDVNALLEELLEADVKEVETISVG